MTVLSPPRPLPAAECATRRQLLVGSAAAVALTACAPAAEQPAATRAVRADFGEVRVPRAPRRVLAATSSDADVAIVLGLPLVATTGARGAANRPFPPYQPADKLRGVARFGIYPTLQLEKVSATRPDCILNGGNTLREYHDQLSPIAPTLTYSKQLFDDWRAGLRLVARAFDRSAAAERFIDGYQRRVRELRARVRARFADRSTAMIFPAGPGQFTIYAEGAQTLRTMAECGFTMSENTPASFDEHRTYSAEEVSALRDVDVLLLFLDVNTDDAEARTLDRDRAAYQGITGSPLWRDLPAVRSGQVYDMPAELAYASPLTAAANLDLIEDSLLG